MKNDDRAKPKSSGPRRPSSASRSTDSRGARDRRSPMDSSRQHSASIPPPNHARPLRKRKKVGLPIHGRRPDAPAWIGHLDHPFRLERKRVAELVERLNIEADVDRLYQHLDLVKAINEEVNLVSRASVDAVLLQSLWESLIPVTNKDWQRGSRILDLGTGGGFPGFPLALTLPDVHMTLLDSRRAKTLSLERMIGEMGVKNISVVHDRAETHAERLEQPYDTIVVRAVSVLQEVAVWSVPLLKPGGTLLSWKGPEGEREAKALDGEKWDLKFALSVLPHRYVLALEHKGEPSTENLPEKPDDTSTDG